MTPKNNYCNFCFNARVYEPSTEEDLYCNPLTDENDLSFHGVGDSQDTANGYRVMIASGAGKPLRIEFDWWFDKRKEWVNVSRYYPKYCPECGRRLDEYEKKPH